MAWWTFQRVIAAGTAAIVYLPAQVPDEPEWFFFAVQLELRTLQDILPTIPSGTGFQVPFGELCRALRLGIRTEPGRGVAEGFFITEKHGFRLDLAAGTVEIEGKQCAFDTSRILRRSEDLYIDIKLLEEWLPIEFQVDIREATITVKPKEQLPIQAQWEREERLGRMSRARGQGGSLDALPAAVPYAFLDMPMIDQTLAFSHQRDSRHAVDYSGSTYLSGDLFWMSSSIYFNLQPDGRLGGFRGTLFREDPHGGLLGPLRAREVSLGDLTLPTVDFLGSGPKGRGILASSYPMDFRSQFDARTFRGNLAPGWSVELIHNSYIIGYQNARPDGLYEFLDVPLRFGLNDFRLIFHGPQGQRRAEACRLDLSDSLVPSGRFYYRVAGLDPAATTTMGEKNLTSSRSPAFRIESDYGLTKSLSINGALFHQAQSSAPQTFGLAGLRLALPFLSIRASTASDANNGQRAALVAFKTGYGYTSLDLSREVYTNWKGLNPLQTGMEENRLLARTRVGFNGSWRVNPLGFQAGVIAIEETYQQHGSQQQLSLNTAAGFRHWSLGNTVSRTTRRSLQSRSVITEGNFRVSREDDPFALRAEVDYARLGGALKVTRGQADFEYRPSEDTNWQMILTRQVLAHQTQVQLGFNKLKGRVGLGFQGQYSRDSGLSLTATLQVSCAREPRTRKWATVSTPLAGQGALSATAFIDGNGNGCLDAKEQPIEAPEFLVNGSRSPKLLEHATVGFLGPVGRNAESYTTVDTLSLEDPFVKPYGKPYSFIPRPGKTLKLDFPLLAFGEITGTAYLKSSKGTQELPGLELDLLRKDGSLAMRQRTAFDGFFDFMGVPPGEYTLQVSQAAGNHLALQPLPPRLLTIQSSGTALDGIDLRLELRQPADPSPGTRLPSPIDTDRLATPQP